MELDEALRIVRNRCWNDNDPEAAEAYKLILCYIDEEDLDAP